MKPHPTGLLPRTQYDGAIFAHTVTDHRMFLGLSQEELANLCRVSLQTVIGWEKTGVPCPEGFNVARTMEAYRPPPFVFAAPPAAELEADSPLLSETSTQHLIDELHRRLGS